jgi:hypothetical protein
VRTPRVVIFDLSGQNSRALTSFFHRKNYETFVFEKAMVCPIDAHSAAQKTCSFPVPCSDIMVVVTQDAEWTTGVDLLTRQLQRACKVTPLNKAIITHVPAHDALANLPGQGMTIFGNPLDFGLFEVWVTECESRLDLSRQFPVRRREKREPCSRRVWLRVNDEVADISAHAVNESNCGLCIRTAYRLTQGQLLSTTGDGMGMSNAEIGIVRWIKTVDENKILAGLTYCV